jgi:opacity protein-like surface antigen
MIRNASTVCVILSLAILAGAVPAAAEGMFDLFAGGAFTARNDIKLRANDARETVRSDFEDSFSVGGRVGYWWSFFGLNLDVSYFRPDPKPDEVTVAGITLGTDLRVVGVGLNAMLRGQFLKSEDTPAGRLQPYVFGGPTAFITVLEADIVGESGTEIDASARLGFTVGGGVTFMLIKQLGLFAEYRFTHNRPEFGAGDITAKPRLDTHHVLGGVTFRF